MGDDYGVVIHEDGTVHLWTWDPTTGHSLLASPLLLIGHTKAVTSVAFSPDGTLLVTTSEDGTAKLWALPRETRSREDIAALIRCRVPWHLDAGRLIRTELKTTACPP